MSTHNFFLHFRFHLAAVVSTVLMFVASLVANEWLFPFSDQHRGINWIYLPAGIRLLSMLLFGEAGAVGLLIASWLVSFCYFFPDDSLRAFMGGILSSAAPYLVYKGAQRYYGLQASLANLTPKRLIACIFAYSFASPILHHLWFLTLGNEGISYKGLGAMIVGDLCGTLIVIYTAKWMLFAVSRRQA